MTDGVPPPPSGTSVPRYALSVGITVFVIASQYFVPELVPATRVVYGSLLGDLLVVYGVPIVTFLALVGPGPLKHWNQRMGLATLEGLQWYGIASLAGLLVVILLTVVYLVVDPGALALLERTNPALQQAVGDPWFFVALSFGVGAIEETIFRGWIFGFWVARGGSWLVPAVWTSALFAAVHLYYGTTYGAAAPLIFPTLFFAGFGFAGAFRASGGNLVVIALLHGLFDASAYLTLINLDVGASVRYGVILVGLVVALLVYLRLVNGTSHPFGSASRGAPPGPGPP
ncbi:MAG TPA: CPBP family intramembrane glutamic endopeptidase [Thermoplasmata archaeon]|nr:CPBP family intramembrane glutamic endopeptidase [Thermoplasmata archaeon]